MNALKSVKFELLLIRTVFVSNLLLFEQKNKPPFYEISRFQIKHLVSYNFLLIKQFHINLIICPFGKHRILESVISQGLPQIYFEFFSGRLSKPNK